MTNLLARILLAMIMFPLAIVLYGVTIAVLMNLLESVYAFVWTTILVAFFVVCYWLGLWRQRVRWTPLRVVGTLLSGPMCVVMGGVVLAICRMAIPYDGGEIGIFLGGILAMLLWLAVTVLIWRETATERSARVGQSAGNVLFCPGCGYNMTGLYESRCPECGGRWSLDQLYGAQRREVIEDVAGAAEGGVGQRE